MKIAILTTHWIGSQGTGIPRYIINIVREFEKHKNMEVSVLFLNGDDPNNFKIDGSRYLFPMKACYVLNKINPDIIYMHTSWFFILTGVIFKAIKKVKLISTVHSDPSKLSYITWSIMNYLINSCDCITYVSRNLQIKIQDIWAIPIKVREEITYPGVKAQSVTENELIEFITKFAISKNSIILLMQSSPIADVKAEGSEKILMQSIKMLLINYPDIKLIITGTGPFLDDLKKYTIYLGIQDNVIFTGWVENPFVPLSICDIYTHISLGEGLPLSILEAMSIGKPIIATPVGGIPEVIDDKRNGLLVDPDAKKIMLAIDTLLKDKKLKTTLGNNAYVDSKKYTWEKSANKFIEIFME